MEIDGLYASRELKEVVIKNIPQKDGTLVDCTIKVRQLTWAKKNKLLSDCFTFGKDGEMKFQMDKYKRAMLMEMIAEAPWGRTDAIFLDQISSNVGDQLDKLVPEAFGDGAAVPDFFAKG